ncbi:hypothetical protein Cgig2_014325 [Carnegiea gigantea]|uniref:Uncharacterized protein n=1 Tax=Carnegiea gigantea TaxID=171969 RepID=A0A9Q1GIW9_9CARY|nr:hypothetical protein Cgig2_014325 [Carnegiea gigantea]
MRPQPSAAPSDVASGPVQHNNGKPGGSQMPNPSNDGPQDVVGKRHASTVTGFSRITPGPGCCSSPRLPRSLTADEMAFPPSLLPSNYEELCPDFVLAETKEYARDYKVPKLSQVIFLAMLLSNVVKLGVPHGWMIGVMESALKELWRKKALGQTTKPPAPVMAVRSEVRLGTAFGTGILQSWHPYGRSLESALKSFEREREIRVVERESRFTILTIAFSPFYDTEEMADHVRKTFTWHWRSASRPLCALPEDYRDLCPRFTFSDAEKTARDFKLPEMARPSGGAASPADSPEGAPGTVDGQEESLVKYGHNVYPEPIRPSAPKGDRRIDPVSHTLRAISLIGLGVRDLRWSAYVRERTTAVERDIGPDMFPNFFSTEQVAQYVRENFLWSLREPSILRPSLLPKKHHSLCLNFNLLMAM